MTEARTAMVLAAGFGERMRPLDPAHAEAAGAARGQDAHRSRARPAGRCGSQDAPSSTSTTFPNSSKRILPPARASSPRSWSRTSAASCSIPAAAPRRRCRCSGMVRSSSTTPIRCGARARRRRSPACCGSGIRRRWTASCCSRQRPPASAMPSKATLPWGRTGASRRRGKDEMVPFAFAGVSLCDERLFKDAPDGRFSLNLLWDRALAKGRLYGVQLDGVLDACRHAGSPGRGRDLVRARRCLSASPEVRLLHHPAFGAVPDHAGQGRA